jgi:hypothetical protein
LKPSRRAPNRVDEALDDHQPDEHFVEDERHHAAAGFSPIAAM